MSSSSASSATPAASAAAARDYRLVERSLGFHGVPMQKVWEGEHGDQDLARAAVVPNFGVYQARQKGFVFGDRAKRLKLHQFLARKADILFERQPPVATARPSPRGAAEASVEGVVPQIVPLNCYFADKHDKTAQLLHIYRLLNVGDIVYAEIKTRTPIGYYTRVLCTRPPNFHYLAELNSKAFLSNAELVAPVDRRGAPCSFAVGDLVMCEILELSVDSQRMQIGMRGMHRDATLDGQLTFGRCALDQFPAAYSELVAKPRCTYTERLDASAEFKNPHGVAELARAVGLDLEERYTNMSGQRGRFPAGEYSGELRQQQASKWAFRSVAEGIEHFKEGRHSEAFQCLNKALSIDPRNVEGLVARGALYANSGSFKKAVEDFETALKLNASHANARKYMGETLVALGRSYEEENNIEEAKNAYQACLNIIPSHEEARNSLDFLWSKTTAAAGAGELQLPALNFKISEQKRGRGSGGSADVSHDKKDSSSRNAKKSKKSKKSKSRRTRDSSSSSSSSSDSSDSSSPSSGSDSSSSSDSDYSKSKKKRRSGRYHQAAKQRSLSPLSKRMASMANESNAAATAAASGIHRPAMAADAFAAYDQSLAYNTQQPDDYEMKVRTFLELTRDEDNYEEKVRQFVEDANRYRKERTGKQSAGGDGGGRRDGSHDDSKSAAKKKEKHKKRKSSQRDAKKKRSKDKQRSKSRSKRDKQQRSSEDKALADLDNMELREALKIIKSLPGLDMSAKLLGMEKTLNQHQKETKKQEDNTKWKMHFAKDRQTSSGGLVGSLGSGLLSTTSTAATATNKLQPKQYTFKFDDDDDDDDDVDDARQQLVATKPTAASSSQPLSSQQSQTSGRSALAHDRGTSPVAYPKLGATNRLAVAATATIAATATAAPQLAALGLGSLKPQALHTIHSVGGSLAGGASLAAPLVKPPAAVVLDKFGSFRLASVEDSNVKPAGGLAVASTSAGSGGGLASTQRNAQDSRSPSRSPNSSPDRRGGGDGHRHHHHHRRSSRRSESRSGGSRSPDGHRHRSGGGRHRSGSRGYRSSGRRGGGGGGGATDRSASRSRSRSRSRYSRRSRSASRSYSRSRSGSEERRPHGGGGGDRRMGGYYRGGGGGGGHGTYYKPYFNNNQNHHHQHHNFRGNNPMHYNNQRGGFRGGYQKHFNPNYHHNNRGGQGQGGYVNNRGGYQNYQNHNNYHNNGGAMNPNYRGRWQHRGGYHGGGGSHYRNYDADGGGGGGSGGRRVGGRDSRSRSADRKDGGDDDDEETSQAAAAESGGYRGGQSSGRRRGGRSSSRSDDDDDDEEGRASSSPPPSRRRSVSKALSTATTASGQRKAGGGGGEKSAATTRASSAEEGAVSSADSAEKKK